MTSQTRLRQERPERLLLTIDDLRDLTRMSRAQVYKEIKQDRFPRPVAVSSNKRAWLYSEVLDWLETRVAERNAKVA